jgi:pyruvate dehydrogenase E1 component alpha subunit
VQAHTNADDASRYRDEDEVKPWLERDPIKRLEAYLMREGLLDDSGKQAVEAAAAKVADALRVGLLPEPEVEPEDLFRHLYTVPTPQLKEQAAFLRDELAREEA